MRVAASTECKHGDGMTKVKGDKGRGGEELGGSYAVSTGVLRSEGERRRRSG